MPTPRRWPAAPGRLAALLTLLAAGCGSSTSTVAGTVTYRGRPVTGGSVILYCEDRQIVRGLIGVDGRYAIPNVPLGTAVVTVQPHPRQPEGLRLPQHLPPSVNGPVPPTGPPGTAPAVPLPPRYALPEESGLSVTVGRDHLTYDIDLNP